MGPDLFMLGGLAMVGLMGCCLLSGVGAGLHRSALERGRASGSAGPTDAPERELFVALEHFGLACALSGALLAFFLLVASSGLALACLWAVGWGVGGLLVFLLGVLAGVAIDAVVRFALDALSGDVVILCVAAGVVAVVAQLVTLGP